MQPETYSVSHFVYVVRTQYKDSSSDTRGMLACFARVSNASRRPDRKIILKRHPFSRFVFGTNSNDTEERKDCRTSTVRIMRTTCMRNQ